MENRTEAVAAIRATRGCLFGCHSSRSYKVYDFERKCFDDSHNFPLLKISTFQLQSPVHHLFHRFAVTKVIVPAHVNLPRLLKSEVARRLSYAVSQLPPQESGQIPEKNNGQSYKVSVSNSPFLVHFPTSFYSKGKQNNEHLFVFYHI
jgi:hypothetical protein